MVRTTFMLSPELRAKALRRASLRGLSLGELIRESLEKNLDSEAPGGEDPMFADKELFQGDHPVDGAINHDEYLYGDKK
ncbi:MAG: hypothetical protein ACE15C_19505 [Phycisphaerae bacterium]